MDNVAQVVDAPHLQVGEGHDTPLTSPVVFHLPPTSILPSPTAAIAAITPTTPCRILPVVDAPSEPLR